VNRTDKRVRGCETLNADTEIRDITVDVASEPIISKWGNPSNVLFLKNLPDNRSAQDIDVLFKNLKGFKFARDSQVLNRPVVFAEFSDVSNCKEAILAMQGKVLFQDSNQGLDIEFAKYRTRETTIEQKITNTIDIRSVIPSAETGRKVEEEEKNRDGPVSKKQRHDVFDEAPPSKFRNDNGVCQVIIRDDNMASSSNSNTHRSVADNSLSLSGSFRQQVVKDSFSLYRSPSGQEVRVWCRFGRNCKSGHHCRFGHEVIEQSLSALQSARNMDLREAI
jgi:hypothetical protein